MSKPWIIWVVSLFCTVLVFVAMGVITRNTLKLEQETADAELRAEHEERVRLAMWRLDALANSIRERENRRPAMDYFPVGDGESEEESLAPLFYENPSFTNGFWSNSKIGETNVLESPQVPVGNSEWSTETREQIQYNKQSFIELKSILNNPTDINDSFIPASTSGKTTNLAVACHSAHEVKMNWGNDIIIENEQVKSLNDQVQVDQNKSVTSGVDFSYSFKPQVKNQKTQAKRQKDVQDRKKFFGINQSEAALDNSVQAAGSLNRAQEVKVKSKVRDKIQGKSQEAVSWAKTNSQAAYSTPNVKLEAAKRVEGKVYTQQNDPKATIEVKQVGLSELKSNVELKNKHIGKAELEKEDKVTPSKRRLEKGVVKKVKTDSIEGDLLDFASTESIKSESASKIQTKRDSGNSVAEYSLSAGSSIVQESVRSNTSSNSPNFSGFVDGYPNDDFRGNIVSQSLLEETYDDPDYLNVSPFVAIWLEGELMLVRHVNRKRQEFIQGVWLDKDQIIQRLLSEVSEGLPDAQIQIVDTDFSNLLGIKGYEGEESATHLVALPFKLITGDVPRALITGMTPMRKTLSIAWVGALCAVFAVASLLRGVLKLSERRASFVSSVTHELRTPLTTFKLYSEMLAGGMIREEEKKIDYLEKLTHESDRLSHLVENVLSYSQIERGSARASVEKISLGSLISRIEDRLTHRLEAEGMSLMNHLPKAGSKLPLEIDTTAVEQILFNIIDNACKYGNSPDGGGVVHLSAVIDAKSVRLRISDEGKGIRKSDRKKLFRAFHKSAAEAAHTKPGVGLGLALCRRLARAMGGDIKIIDPKEKAGACFELQLPIK